MKGSGSFWMTIIWNKRKKFDERTEARVGSNPPPHQPPFAYLWSVTCFCTKKRNAYRCTCLRCSFCFKTIQNKQAKFVAFTFTFSYRKDQNNVTSTKSLKDPQPSYSQESQVSTESPLSNIMIGWNSWKLVVLKYVFQRSFSTLAVFFISAF